MAMIETLRPAGFARGVTAAFGSLKSWNDARITRRALNGLTEKELEDIGLVRGDIDMIAQNCR